MKYEKIAECPKVLKEWIELINDAPYGRSTYLRSWDILLGNAYFEIAREDVRLLEPPPEFYDIQNWHPPTPKQLKDYDNAIIQATQSLKEETKEFPKIYSYLFENEDFANPKNIYDEIRFDVRKYQYEKTAFYRYGIFLQMRKDMFSIAHTCMRYHKTGEFIDKHSFFEILARKPPENGYHTKFVIKNGKIDFESEIVRVLRGVDATRLRVCPICNEIFWAKRIETNTCSKKRCSNNFHQRKLRIKELEKRFDKEYEKLDKQRKMFADDNPLVKKQMNLINKIKEKIYREQNKNGTL